MNVAGSLLARMRTAGGLARAIGASGGEKGGARAADGLAYFF